MNVARPRQRILGLWDGPVLLVFLAVLDVLALAAEPGTPSSGRAQSRLLVLVIAAAVLFVIRARGRYETQNIISGREGFRGYAASGLLGLDAFFLMSALSVVLVLDIGIWSSAGVKIGTVAELAIIRLIGTATRRGALRRSPSGGLLFALLVVALGAAVYMFASSYGVREPRELVQMRESIRTGEAVPSALRDGWARLVDSMSVEEIRRFRQAPEWALAREEFHSLSIRVTNDEMLAEGAPLQRYFLTEGIDSQEDMAVIVIVTLHRRSFDKPIRLESELRRLRRTGDAGELHDRQMRPPTRVPLSSSSLASNSENACRSAIQQSTSS